jgi:hypothetical protein
MPKTLNPSEGTRQHETFCLVESGAAVRQAPEVLQWRTDDGLRPSDEWLAAEGFYGLITAPRPSIDERTQKTTLMPLNEWAVDASAGTVTQVWLTEPLTEEELSEATDKQAEKVRTRRLQLLLLSDYTQVADFAGERGLWAAYRQQLRDITTQQGFPWEVVWPTEPQ